ncbi:hypothetical protein L7F22_003734 [Adiantum nelumboides]|nr:hypothetical protein [Adiantum nelumboides]
MIVFLKSEAEHMEHLRAVFEMLQKERLVANENKSEFFMEEIHFLGHIVSKDGVRMDPAKIKAIQDWPQPVNLQVHSFLGLCSTIAGAPDFGANRVSVYQSEEGNSIVLDLLKCCVSEHKATWERYLPLVEYASNNTVHTSTSKAPFEIVEGGKKIPPILQTKDKIFEADKYVQNTDEAYRKIKLALQKTQSKQKKVVDRHRRELVFSLGDWVLLRFEKTRLRKMKGKERLFPKLGMRYYGPFQICDKISDVACRLKLPEGRKIHNAFHVSLLRPFVGDVSENMVPEEQPEVEELDEILVPEQILAHKERKVRGKVAKSYLVEFKNYSPMDAKWMEEAELADSPELLQLYLEAFQLQLTVT